MLKIHNESKKPKNQMRQKQAPKNWQPYRILNILLSGNGREANESNCKCIEKSNSSSVYKPLEFN